jgi:hypothetical protein
LRSRGKLRWRYVPISGAVVRLWWIVFDRHRHLNPISPSPSRNEVAIMERLDEFSKLLAASVSRRESLRSIGAVLAGVALSPLGLSTAWAARPDRCTAFCRRCSTRKRRNQCLTACRACNGNTSRLCGSCGAYVCCASSTACCNGTCTAVNADPNNCGACGNVCGGSTPVCIQGTCGNCPPTAPTFCSGVCTYLGHDSANCGACGNVCPPQFACAAGVCEGTGG